MNPPAQERRAIAVSRGSRREVPQMGLILIECLSNGFEVSHARIFQFAVVGVCCNRFKRIVRFRWPSVRRFIDNRFRIRRIIRLRGAPADEQRRCCKREQFVPHRNPHLVNGRTKKLGSSQPTTSPHRRTLSRVCSNALFGLLGLLLTALPDGSVTIGLDHGQHLHTIFVDTVINNIGEPPQSRSTYISPDHSMNLGHP